MVPFVAKVLESCAESRVFKPPNPWTMGIMSVLSELHALPDLKVCEGVCVCMCICECVKCAHESVWKEFARFIPVFVLQLNLRFEIEVLCKHLLLEISVSASNHL